jgi:hypothetical protein
MNDPTLAPPVRLQLHGAAAWQVSEGAPQPLERKHAALLAKLEAAKAMDKDAEAELTAAIGAFKKTFA